MTWVAFDRGSRALSNLALSGRSIIGGACANVSTMMSARMDFDEELGTFTQSYGVKQLDASLLMIALVGFLPPEDKRVRGTVEAIEQRLVVAWVRAPLRYADRRRWPSGWRRRISCLHLLARR